MELLDEANLDKVTLFLSQWKSYQSKEQITDFVSQLTSHPNFTSHVCLLGLPYVHLQNFGPELARANVIVGSTYMHDASPGSFTESNAGKLLKDIGARFVMIGTSECRQLFHEDSTSIHYKIKKALESGVVPFLCIGETLEQLYAGQSEVVLKQQLEEGLAGLNSEQLAKIVVVYEAPWLRKDPQKTSKDKLIECYIACRKAMVSVFGDRLFPSIPLIDAFPSDVEDLKILLDSIHGKGVYAQEPKVLFKLLEFKATWPQREIPPVYHEQKVVSQKEELSEEPEQAIWKKYEPSYPMEKKSPVKSSQETRSLLPVEENERSIIENEETLASLNEETSEVMALDSSEEESDRTFAPEVAPFTSFVEEKASSILDDGTSVSDLEKTILSDIEEVSASHHETEPPVSKNEEKLSPSLDKTSLSVDKQDEPISSDKSESSTSKELLSSTFEEGSSLSVDEEAEESVSVVQNEITTESLTPKEPVKKIQSQTSGPHKIEETLQEEHEPFLSKEEMQDLSLSLDEEFSDELIKENDGKNMNEDFQEINDKLERMKSLEDALGQCYTLIREKGELLPKLRSLFPEKLSKMTADLNQLNPELQEKINKGDVAFFNENPHKAKEAEGVLAQLKELNYLLQQTASIPRDIDRLQSKGKDLRKSLENEWAYFNNNRRKIKELYPEYPFPQQPSILLEKSPTIDFAPPATGPTTLTGKRFAVVKTPPAGSG